MARFYFGVIVGNHSWTFIGFGVLVFSSFTKNKFQTYQILLHTQSSCKFCTTFVCKMTEHVSTLKEVEDAVSNNDVVVVKVGATWCPPCQKVQPLYEAEAKSSFWKALVYDISKTTKRDQDPIMSALGVVKIPFFAVFKVRPLALLLGF